MRLIVDIAAIYATLGSLLPVNGSTCREMYDIVCLDQAIVDLNI